jgi:nitrate/TMAO reductase-like tetraheme cytochrome c subunit
MTLTSRLTLAAGLLVAFCGALSFLASGEPAGGAAARTRWESSAQCKECHEDVYEEWLGSHHQIAFTNPEVRALSDDFRKQECMDCHLPRPLVVTLPGKPQPRNTWFDEGVSCISCHLGPDGGIVGGNDRPEVPCRPKRNEQLMSVDACASCHNQHGTTDQWRASHYAEQGTDCASCHMPEAKRTRKDGSTRFGRSHVWRGCHDVDTLKKAGRFEVERKDGEIVMTLTNVGAGHNFPTEERHRAVDMVYRFVTEDGPGEWQRAWRFRMPYRDESTPINPGNEPGENTQLPAGKSHSSRVPIAVGARAVEVRLWYRLTPFCGDEDPRSTLLEERRLELQ